MKYKIVIYTTYAGGKTNFDFRDIEAKSDTAAVAQALLEFNRDTPAERESLHVDAKLA